MAKPRTGRVIERSCRMIRERSLLSFDSHGEKHLGFRKGVLLRGRAIRTKTLSPSRASAAGWPTMRTCTSTRMGFHPISHASPVTGGARKSKEKKPRGASFRGSCALARARHVYFCSALSTCAFSPSSTHESVSGLRQAKVCRRCLTSPPERCRSWEQELSGSWGSALEAERRRKSRSSLRRIELESSLHPKRKNRAA